MALSLVFLFFENFRPFFKYLSVDFWCSVVFGSIIILSMCYIKIGMITQFKCHLHGILLIYGFTFTFIPFFYKLIIRFPEELDFPVLVKKYKYVFYLTFLIIDSIFCGVLMIIQYDINTVMIEDGENFQKCKIGSAFGMIVLVLAYIYKGFILLCMLLLIFSQWNIKSTVLDMQLTLTAVYIDIILIIILTILNLVSINSYILFNVLQQLVIFLIASSNYILTYGYRLIMAILHKSNLKSKFIKSINIEFVNDSECNFKSKNDSNHKKGSKNINEITCMNPNSGDIVKTNSNNQISEHETITEDLQSPNMKPSLLTRIMNCHYVVDSENSLVEESMESESAYSTKNGVDPLN